MFNYRAMQPGPRLGPLLVQTWPSILLFVQSGRIQDTSCTHDDILGAGALFVVQHIIWATGGLVCFVRTSHLLRQGLELHFDEIFRCRYHCLHQPTQYILVTTYHGKLFMFCFRARRFLALCILVRHRAFLSRSGLRGP